MKKIALFLVLVLAVVYCKEDSSSSEEVDLKEVDEFVKQKFNTSVVSDTLKLVEKVKAKCPDLDDKIPNVLDEVKNCTEEIEFGSETFCSLIRKNFVPCTQPVVDLVKGCFPDESKTLPALFQKVTLAVIDQVCNSTVEEILELFNPCVAEKDLETFPVCKDIVTVFQSHRNKLPDKSLFCETLPKVKNCVKAHQDASCKNPITRSALINFYEAIEDSTKDDCDTLNKVQ